MRPVTTLATLLLLASGPTKIENTSLVRVSANVELKGSLRGLRAGQPRVIVLSGVGDFSGEGGLASGPMPVTATAIVDGASGCVAGLVRPEFVVLLERGDRYVAGARVEGTVPVSGCTVGGRLELSGRGVLSGDALAGRSP